MGNQASQGLAAAFSADDRQREDVDRLQDKVAKLERELAEEVGDRENAEAETRDVWVTESTRANRDAEGRAELGLTLRAGVSGLRKALGDTSGRVRGPAEGILQELDALAVGLASLPMAVAAERANATQVFLVEQGREIERLREAYQDLFGWGYRGAIPATNKTLQDRKLRMEEANEYLAKEIAKRDQMVEDLGAEVLFLKEEITERYKTIEGLEAKLGKPNAKAKAIK